MDAVHDLLKVRSKTATIGLISTGMIGGTVNAMYFEHLATLARPHGAAGHSAVPVAGDDETAKNTVTAFLDAIGYDARDVGPLGEGWRFQADAIADTDSTDGSFDHPHV